MYRSFTIKNFRCFDELTVEGMDRINLIAARTTWGRRRCWRRCGCIAGQRIQIWL